MILRRLYGIFSMLAIWTVLAVQVAAQNAVPLLPSDSVRIKNAMEQALKEAEAGDWREESRHYDNIAFIYWEHNYFSKAVEWYQKSLKLNEKLANRAGISMINSNLGMLYADLKDYDRSLAHFQRTFDYRKMMKDKQGVITTAINMSVVLNNLKRFDESAALLQEALTLARELNDPDQMKSCYGMLSETYEKARQSDKARYYFDLYRTFHEQVQKEKEQKSRAIVEETRLQLQLTEAEKRNKELELQLAEHEIQQKEKELATAGEKQRTLYENLSRTELQNELLQRDNELKKTQIAGEKERNEKQRVQMLFLLVSLGLFGVLLFVILKAYLDKRKTNRILDSQKREIESQRDAISKAFEQLKELTDYKEGIRSMIVHDLKNPLNSILNPPLHYSDQLKIETARRAGRRMLNLVMDILDVQKLEESHLKPEKQPVDCNTLLAEAIAEVEYLGQPRGLLFQKLADQPLKVACDPELIHRVIVNLLTNAVKYAYQQTEIVVMAVPCEDASRVKIAVSNRGDGIPSDFIGSVFDKFTQHSARKSGGVASTGIGLTFCKLTVEAHGGAIGVESEPGENTTFWFTLEASHDEVAPLHSNSVPLKTTAVHELTEADRLVVEPVRRQLQMLEIHQITKIRKAIRLLDQHRNERIDYWLENLLMAVETNDIKKYNSIVRKNDHTNS
ncbi:MAG: ATP-binding protein [Bacteroidales bacterium]|nr:ATP-binding protein [Bacteroidales bacterium]MDD3666362.1 ATP-binding protein [Bacteroidales bacterium]